MYLSEDAGPRLDSAPSLGGLASLGDWALLLTLRLNFQIRGFGVTDPFLEQYAKLSAAGRVGSSEDFRKEFCKADHYRFELTNKSNKTKRFHAAKVWGHAVIYTHRPGQRPLLGRMQSMQWLLQQKGASIRQPQFPLCKKAFAPSQGGELLKGMLFDMLEEKTDMSRAELERLIERALKSEEAPQRKP
jgi:hypothetical protein